MVIQPLLMLRRSIEVQQSPATFFAKHSLMRIHKIAHFSQYLDNLASKLSINTIRVSRSRTTIEWVKKIAIFRMNPSPYSLCSIVCRLLSVLSNHYRLNDAHCTYMEAVTSHGAYNSSSFTVLTDTIRTAQPQPLNEPLHASYSRLPHMGLFNHILTQKPQVDPDWCWR